MVQEREKSDEFSVISIQGIEPGKTVYCKLFNDMVTPHLCILRRKELNAKGGFSCEGCSMNTEASMHANAKMRLSQTSLNSG